MTTLPVLHAPWLEEEATQTVMHALAQDGGEPRFVGGAVRNTLLGEEVVDVDIATPLKPHAVLSCLTRHNIKAIPTGVDHGTVTAVLPQRHFEITTLRRDIATDGRHAKVEYGTDWSEDAGRRDFTFNALYADAEGRVYDPLNGYADLAARRVRFIGEARMRIREDYLRILRYFRFQARYGGPIDEDALRACTVEKTGLAQLSAERLQKEFFLLLCADHAVEALTVMKDAGILDMIIPGGADVARLRRLIACKADKPADEILRLAALIGDGSAGGTALRLRLAQRDEKRLVEISSGEKLVPDLAPAKIRRLIYTDGLLSFSDRAWLACAGDEDPSCMQAWRDLITKAGVWVVPVFPLSGADLLARGVMPGPQMGELLSRLEGQWMNEDFKLSKEELLARLDADLAGRG